MKTKLNLKPNLSFKALEVKAEKASAIAAAARKKATPLQSKKMAKAKPSRTRPLIDRQVSSFLRSVERIYADSHEVRIDRPSKNSSCHSIISVYAKPDVPLQKFALYPSNFSDRKLGSVAIYGDDAFATKAMIEARGSLFGHSIRMVRVEMGRRPFVDVTLNV